MDAETKKQVVPPNCHRPSRAQELPPEVLDIILSYFLDTKQILLSCSLVCKHWLGNARRYLFRTITIRLQDGWTNQEILNFLTNSPDRRWIKNIVIHGWWSRPLKLSFLAACLSKLPTILQSLSLVDLPLDSHETLSESLGRLPTIQVEMLELSQTGTPAIGFIQILSIFSAIETLVIHGGSEWFPEGLGVPMGLPPSFGSLFSDMGVIEQRVIRGLRAGRGCSLSYMRYLHGVLRKYCSSTSFTTLHLPVLSKNTLLSAHDWLVDENERLTGLSLDFSSDPIARITASNRIPNDQLGDPEISFDLRQLGLTSLTSLSVSIGISILHTKGRPLRIDMWKRLTTIVSSAPPGLTHLKIGLVTSGALNWVMDLQDIDWEALGSVIAEFCELKSLAFARRHRDFDHDEIAVIRRHLKDLKLSPAISIHFCRD